jgi:hypothetical protein
METIRMSPFREEIEEEWENVLGHQLREPLPPFAAFWSTLDDVIGWLAGAVRIVQLPRVSLGVLNPDWDAAKAITSSGRGVPLGLLRDVINESVDGHFTDSQHLALCARRIGLWEQEAPKDSSRVVAFTIEPIRYTGILMSDYDAIASVGFQLNLGLIE